MLAARHRSTTARSPSAANPSFLVARRRRIAATGGSRRITLPSRDIVTGVALMVLVGIVAGILPAAGAMRLKITDALRKA